MTNYRTFRTNEIRDIIGPIVTFNAPEQIRKMVQWVLHTVRGDLEVLCHRRREPSTPNKTDQSTKIIYSFHIFYVSLAHFYQLSPVVSAWVLERTNNEGDDKKNCQSRAFFVLSSTPEGLVVPESKCPCLEPVQSRWQSSCGRRWSFWP